MRYKRFWNKFKSRGIDIPTFIKSYENTLESEGKLKFFSVNQCSQEFIKFVVQVLDDEKNSSYILALNDDSSLNARVNEGWSNDDTFDKLLIKYTVENKGILFKKFGDFDDLERGFIGIGDPEIIKDITR